MRNKPRCIVKNIKEKKSCSNEMVIKIKVTLYHPNSERKSNQNWYFCEEHLNKFLGTNGLGWYRWYNNRELISPVIDYEIISCTEFISINTLRKMDDLGESDEKLKYKIC